jgi:hypothetical protein
MKSISFVNKSILCVVFTFGIYPAAIAQKVSNIQSGSIWAPADVKIDGNLAEWGPALQAHNKTTHVWYTVANDDKNIYLVIKSADADNNTKILAGGISFTVNTEGKKKDKNAYVVTYPVISRTGGGGRGGRRRGGFGGGDQDTPDSAAVIAQQKQTLATSKEISTLGFKEITDTLISIYNEYGIKAAANIDDKGNFVYEMSVPLSMLGLQNAGAKEIAYNIKVNGLQLTMGGFKNVSLGNGVSMTAGGGFGGGGGGGGRGGGGGGRGGGDGSFGSSSLFGRNKGDSGSSSSGGDMQDLTSPVDFWGKYTLAVSTGK